MNPEILRIVAKQQMRDAQVRAHRQRTVRALRASRRHTVQTDDFAIPPIPDYVDGSFQADHAASEVPAARTAA